LNEWGLIFAGYLTYSEVWGSPRRGLTTRQAAEVGVAYEEWERFRDAYKKWEERHDPSVEPIFDRQKYMRKRRREIEEEL
jgi:hypothetical protein